MPTEMRHIIFETAETLQAVRLYQIHMGAPMPAGSVLSSSVEVDAPTKLVRFRVSVMPDPVQVKGQMQMHQAPERHIAIEGTALAAALLIYCRKNGIPMPAKADKHLEAMGKKVCLVATLKG